MQGKSYRLNAEALGIFSGNQDRIAAWIPSGTVVTVVNGPLNGNRMVDVLWDGKIIMVFADDLRERGELVMLAVASGFGLDIGEAAV